MLFKEAKEILNNKGYKLVEYYTEPPEDEYGFWERIEEGALESAKYATNSVAESIEKKLKEKCPGVNVYVDDVISNEDGEEHKRKWVWEYTESFTCKLKFEVPIKYLNVTEEVAMSDDSDDLNTFDDAMENFFDNVINSIKTDIVFDDFEDIDIDKTQKTGTMTAIGTYEYKKVGDN